MKIALLTLGTRGDVQPYLALAMALAARGHDIAFGAPDDFEARIQALAQPQAQERQARRSGEISFHPIGVDIEAFMRSEEARAFISGGWRGWLGFPRLWRERVRPMMRAMLDGAWAAARDADVILHHPKVFVALDIAEATGAVPIMASPVPMVPTGAFPIIVWTGDYGAWLNRLSWRLMSISRAPYAKTLDQWRRDALGLGRGRRIAPIGAFGDGVETRLCAVSPAVLPRPSDWDEKAHMTGYWFLDDAPDWSPDPALARFLESGPPPVYIGFGSMTDADPQGLARRIVDGVVKSGQRAVLALGWGGMARIETPDTVHVIDAAPHEHLFPRMAAVAHHGGAGTTGAGLRAGRPTLICPQAVDQPFWGRRVRALGCGPDPLPIRRLTAEKLAARLMDLASNEAYATSARAVADGVSRDNGVARAVEIIETAAMSEGAHKSGENRRH